LSLDALRAGDLDPEHAEGAARHLHECGQCSARRVALDTDAARYLERPDFAEPLARARALHAQRTRKRRSTWITWITCITGATSAAAILALSLLGTHTTQPKTERRKGRGSIGFYVARDGQVFRGQPGEHVRPGDRLRFTYRSDREGYLAILSLDAQGVASVFYPAPGSQRALVPTGAEIELPVAVELDATLGPEQVFVLECSAPPAVDALKQALAQHREIRAPDGCAVQRILLHKEPAP
jgi:hypothetical protein